MHIVKYLDVYKEKIKIFFKCYLYSTHKFFEYKFLFFKRNAIIFVLRFFLINVLILYYVKIQIILKTIYVFFYF